MIRIHIIRSEAVEMDLYDGVATLLNQFAGPMKFHTDEDYARFLDNEIQEKYIAAAEF